MTLSLQQVKDAGLPASIPEIIGKHGCEYTIDYLPNNPRQERFRVSGSPYGRTTFGPGGEFTPQDGWHHEDGCGCEFCNTESEATP